MTEKYELSDDILRAEGLVRDSATPSGYRVAAKTFEWCCPCCGDWRDFEARPKFVQCENRECGWSGSLD